MPRAGSDRARRLLRRVYRRLLDRHGHAGWWPAESPFEVCVGAILVQNTAWANVERTLERLRARSLLSYEGLDRLSASRLAPLLRSSGTFRVKARCLRAFLDFLGSRYGGRVEGMRAEGPDELRRTLLAVAGIGPETADSIALYAAGKPLFVVGAYTRRVFARLGLLPGRPRRRRSGSPESGSSRRRQPGEGQGRPSSSDPGRRASSHPGRRASYDHGRPASYDHVQRYVMDRLPRDPALYGDYHAQLVRLGKDHCRPRPRCAGCPLDDLCPKHGVPSSRRARLCLSS